MGEWRIDELAQRAGVAVDTIRYYQREGLLPAGERAGRAVRYGPRHLERLERIRALQSRRFSLAAIRALLDPEGGPGSLETLLAGREGAAYDHDELIDAAGVAIDLVRGLEKTGLLRAPDTIGQSAYDADDVDVLRSFVHLRSLGVPDDVLFELARILNDGIESVQQQTAAVFHGEQGPDWGPGVLEQFKVDTTGESARMVRDMRAIADYVQHRSIQRIVLRELEQPRGARHPHAER
ncbi:MAG: MerR family transcriptional regulator [Acidimicrobiia bacterium]